MIRSAEGGEFVLAAGRYRLDELLGRGAMGEVWRARDTALGRDVAVKLLLEHTEAPDAAERFRREARTAARLNHPNVVAAYDFDEENGRGYLVMELVPGRSLRQELAERGPLDAQQARRFVAQAAAGLAAAHADGVVHRDIKPGNLLLTADDTVKVADFGIARAVMGAASALTTTGEVLGTTPYLAPERGSGGDAGPESDIYALGCVLYEMLCGRPPFTGDPAAVVYQHVSAEPQPLTDLRPDIPADLSDLTTRMLDKDPTSRPTAGQVAGFLSGDSPSGGSVGTLGSTGQEAGTSRSTVSFAPVAGRRFRKPAMPVLAALVAVFVAACMVGFQLSSMSTDGNRAPAPAESPSSSPRQDDSTPPPDDGPGRPGKAKDHPGNENRQAEKEQRQRQEEAAKEREKEARKGAPEKHKQKEAEGNKGP